MRILWLLAALSISFFHLVLMVGIIEKEGRKIEAREVVRRLSRVTIKFFNKGAPPTGAVFWKTIGKKEPLRDPWGLPYELDLPSAKEFRWLSAGPDRKRHTEDDLISRMPFSDGQGVDFPQADFYENTTPQARDAI
jgi:hypothetical protein